MASAHFAVFNHLQRTGPAACADTWLCHALLIISVTHVTGPWPGPEVGMCMMRGLCSEKPFCLSALRTLCVCMCAHACVLLPLFFCLCKPGDILPKGTAACLWSQLFSSSRCYDFGLLDVLAGQSLCLLLTPPGLAVMSVWLVLSSEEKQTAYNFSLSSHGSEIFPLWVLLSLPVLNVP